MKIYDGRRQMEQGRQKQKMEDDKWNAEDGLRNTKN